MNLKTTLGRFPDIELSYDKMLHKKVRSDCFQLLPRGKKALLWITYCNDKNIALVLNLDRNGSIINASFSIMSFSDDLCIGDGTVMQGVLFKNSNMQCFAITDIILYKGQKCNKERFGKKFDIIEHIFKNEINNTPYSSNFLVLGLPITTDNFKKAIDIAKTLPYPIYGIRSISYKNSRSRGYTLFKEKQELRVTMIVKAMITNDMYNLYASDSKKTVGVAAVTDYKSSVMMNKIFRYIKENENLDLLEESDDDEEFEDVREDKYVNLDKSIPMICVWVKKFRKWKPISIAKKTDKVASIFQIQAIERKNIR